MSEQRHPGRLQIGATGKPERVPAFFPPPYQPPNDPSHDRIELTPELLDYVKSCVRAAPPSSTRAETLRALGGGTDDAWELPTAGIDWGEVEAEAERQGCTVADIVFDRAGRRPDPI
jgi:hypothetical protein